MSRINRKARRRRDEQAEAIRQAANSLWDEIARALISQGLIEAEHESLESVKRQCSKARGAGKE